MNAKKVNFAFFISILLHVAVVFLMAFFGPGALSNLIVNNLVSELIVVLPGLLLVLASGERPLEFLGFRKMKIGTALAVLPFTLLSMPFITLLNLISQFWVPNTAAMMMEGFQAAALPFGALFLSMGIFGPLCEELVCRGIFYRGYRKSAGAFGAMLLSALLFAVIHMNLNQALYAFAVGILAVMVTEAAGSLWAAVLYHGIINSSQVLLMYVSLKMNPAAYSQAAEQTALTDTLLYGVAGYLVLAAVTLPLAWALLVWMSGHEGRRGALLILMPTRKKEHKKEKDKLVTIPLIAGLILCLLLML